MCGNVGKNAVCKRHILQPMVSLVLRDALVGVLPALHDPVAALGAHVLRTAFVRLPPEVTLPARRLADVVHKLDNPNVQHRLDAMLHHAWPQLVGKRQRSPLEPEKVVEKALVDKPRGVARQDGHHASKRAQAGLDDHKAAVECVEVVLSGQLDAIVGHGAELRIVKDGVAIGPGNDVWIHDHHFVVSVLAW